MFLFRIYDKEGQGKLVVASGTGNEPGYPTNGYEYIVVITWGHGLTPAPSWFSPMLFSISNCICQKYEKLDVLGLSRGVQAFMICYAGS